MAKSKTYPNGGRRIAPKRRRASKRTGPLAAWLAKHEMSLSVFAANVDASVQHISNLCHGHSSPSRELAVAIENQTNGAVPVDAWS